MLRYKLCAHMFCSAPPLPPAAALEDTPTASLRQCLQFLSPANRLDLSVKIVLAKPIQCVLQYSLYLHVVTKQMGADSLEREGRGREREGGWPSPSSVCRSTPYINIIIQSCGHI